MRHLQELREEHRDKRHLERSVAIATLIFVSPKGGLLEEVGFCRLGRLTSIIGKDDEIYCKSCYARKFGAPGYRGAGCGDWTDAKVLLAKRKPCNLFTYVCNIVCCSRQRPCVQTPLRMLPRSREMRKTQELASGAR